jgi:hypothetical protein
MADLVARNEIKNRSICILMLLKRAGRSPRKRRRSRSSVLNAVPLLKSGLCLFYFLFMIPTITKQNKTKRMKQHELYVFFFDIQCVVSCSSSVRKSNMLLLFSVYQKTQLTMYRLL